ncbi:MAG: domain, FtsQ-type [Patescibacteria group bacterium]|nr:domain, FtsQ-type [Patescibacteria group bacterium]
MNKKNKKGIKADYQAKNLKNPFYRATKKKKKGRLRVVIFFALIFVVALFWLIFAAPFLEINKIEITGLERVKETEINNIFKDQKAESKALILKENNFFLFDSEEFENKLINNYNFAQVKVRKKFPDTLSVIISERPYAFIFQEGTNFYFASADAYIIKDEAVSEEAKNRYFILENRSQIVKITDNGKINIKPDYLDFIFALHTELTKYPDLKLKRLIIEQELNSVLVELDNGPLVYFNSQKDPIIQVEDLALVKKEKIGDNFSSTKYIDLRYGNMIYIN